MTEETPEQTVARLERELADAKVEQAEQRLRAATDGVTQAPHQTPPEQGAWQQPTPQMYVWNGQIPQSAQYRQNGPTPQLPPNVADMLSPLLANLSQMGYGDRFAGLRNLAGPPPPQQPVDTRLSEPPRKVPAAFVLSSFPWRWWDAFTVVIGTAAPIALWMWIPYAAAVAVLAYILVLAIVRGRGAVTRLRLLRGGVVATVDGAEVTSEGTYFSGTTLNNMRVAQARGWDVMRRTYSGPSTTTKIKYHVGNAGATLTMRGLPYVGGVILALPHRPSTALCVSSFPYDLARYHDGTWLAVMSRRVWISSIFGLIFWIALIAYGAFVIDISTRIWG